MIGRFARFLVSGGLTTAVVYVAWILLLKVTDYPLATALAWALGVGLGFALNRRFTFGVAGAEHRGRHFSLFVIGAVGQLLIAEVATYVTMGRLGLSSTWAFLINLALNTTFSFVFMSLVIFRRPVADA